MVLTFLSFDVERDCYASGACACFDYLEVSHGNYSERFCGTDLPASVTTTFTMTLKLVTGYFGERSGFLASVCCDVSVSGTFASKSQLTIHF